jgi:4-carboxymuconolactone decarboxylase
MNLKLASAIALALAAATLAAQNAPVFQLRGDRFRPLTWQEMTPAQKQMTQNVLGGERGSMNGAYNVLLRSPEMGDLAQKYGAHTRFHFSLRQPLKEIAILTTVRYWNSQYPWYTHHLMALDAGLSPAIIDALAAGTRPASMEPDEEAVYDFCRELLETKQVSDATFRKAVDRLGERGVVDVIGVMGYYQLVAMALNVDRYPLPEGVRPELPPLQ